LEGDYPLQVLLPFKWRASWSTGGHFMARGVGKMTRNGGFWQGVFSSPPKVQGNSKYGNYQCLGKRAYTPETALSMPEAPDIS